MKSSELKPVRFVDDGYPEAREYANNYLAMPMQQHRLGHSTTSLRAVLRWLRRRLNRKMQPKQIAGVTHVGYLA